MDGLVPSGVASVTLNYPAGRDRARRVPPLRVTGEVVNNAFVVFIADFGAARSWPSTVTWRIASGHVIKTINETPSTPTLTRPLICRVSTDIR